MSHLHSYYPKYHGVRISSWRFLWLWRASWLLGGVTAIKAYQAHLEAGDILTWRMKIMIRLGDGLLLGRDGKSVSATQNSDRRWSLIYTLIGISIVDDVIAICARVRVRLLCSQWSIIHSRLRYMTRLFGGGEGEPKATSIPAITDK